MNNQVKKSDPSQPSNHYYAVIDLGSNSFHLLVTQLLADNTFTVMNKVKRKVRLASGLDSENNLSGEAISRALDCLSLFANHLENIPLENLTIVATAALRIANNRDVFFNAANEILPKNIKLLSGEQEAEAIFIGATYLNSTHEKQLVLDIGGASTELVIGENSQINKAISLNIGCVSFQQKYFTGGILSKQNFSTAINAARLIIQPIANIYTTLGWQSVVGSSGTMQALAEILTYRQQVVVITKAFLDEIKDTLIAQQRIDAVFFEGLRADRTPVLASGLAILVALFDCLKIDSLQLSTGALREGLLFTLLSSKQNK